MAYEKATDLESIQADVLTTDTSTNAKITGLKKLKTDNKIVTKAINEIFSLLSTISAQSGNAVTSANEANEAVSNMKDEVPSIVQEVLIQKMTEIISGGIYNDELTCADNQTVFVLTKKPLDKDNILFYVNGVKYPKNNFSYDAEANTITWNNVVVDEDHPHAFALKATDVISAVYMA